MEFLEKLGIGREVLEQNAPVAVGAVGALVALVVLQFGARRGWRAAKAAYAWLKKPSAPPEPGTEKWICTTLAALMTPDQDDHWVQHGSYHQTTLGSPGTKIRIGDPYVYCVVHLDTSDNQSAELKIYNRKFRRTVRRLRDRFEAVEKEAERRKAVAIAIAALQNVNTAKAPEITPDAVKSTWQLRLTRVSDSTVVGNCINSPVQEMSPAAAAEWAYAYLAGEKPNSIHKAELTRAPHDGVPAVIMAWVWEPAAQKMCLLITQVAAIPGLIDGRAAWQIGDGLLTDSAYDAWCHARRGSYKLGTHQIRHRDENGYVRLVGYVFVS